MDLNVNMIFYTALAGAFGAFMGDIASTNIRWISKVNGNSAETQSPAEAPQPSTIAAKYDLGTVGSLLIGAFVGAVTWGLGTTQSIELELALAGVAGISGQYFILRLRDRRIQQDTTSILADIVSSLLEEIHDIQERLDGIDIDRDLEGDNLYEQ